MAISDELTRIQTAKADIKASIEAKGVTIPSDALINQYADYVDQIQTGGGGGQAEEDLINLIEGDIVTLNIPNGTTKIGVNAFDGCAKLTSINIPNSVTSIGDYAFSNCSDLTSITIGSGVTKISDNAFYWCRNLTSINIPNSVTSIGVKTFYYCSGLTNVTIGSGVTSIGYSAFNGCLELTSITIEATTPPTLSSSNAFSNSNNCIIYVPAESVDAYKAATNWSSLASRIQAIK